MLTTVRTTVLSVLSIACILLLPGAARSSEGYEASKKQFEGLLKQAVSKGLNQPEKSTIASRAKGGSQSNNGWAKAKIGGKEVDVWKGPAERLKPVNPEGVPTEIIPGSPPPTQLCAKVWAELSDQAGTHTGQFVSIELYKWQPKQRFYLWLESPSPIQLSLVQYYDVGPAEAKDPRLVLPDAKFPNSYATVCPGKPFAFPQLLEMDNNLRDEFVTLTIVVAGELIPVTNAGGQSTLVLPPINSTTTTVVTQTEVNTTASIFGGLNQGPVMRGKSGEATSFKSKNEDLRRMTAVNPDLTGGATQVSTDANHVALFALGAQTIGHLPLRFTK